MNEINEEDMKIITESMQWYKDEKIKHLTWTGSGYELTDYLFKKIGEDEHHRLSISDALMFIRFFGLVTVVENRGKIGFVARCARDTIDHAIVWENYGLVKIEGELEKVGV